MIIVSDTSPISNLILIGRIDLLHQLFDTVIIPPAVNAEIVALKRFGKNIAEYESAAWIKVSEPANQHQVLILKTKLDVGEAEAIALAIELRCDLLLIDERLGTRIALEQGLQTLGLLGVLIKAKNEGLISLVEPILDDLENLAGFWIGESLRQKVLARLGENK